MIGQRTSLASNGSAFPASHHDVFAYNATGEIVECERFASTPSGPGSALPGGSGDREYNDDATGNRLTADLDADPGTTPVFDYAPKATKIPFTGLHNSIQSGPRLAASNGC